jgi:RHS repeat-associated protein
VYYLADGLGSTMATTDASGNVVNTYAYDPYGATTSLTGSQPNPYQFAGQATDATGLQYLRARYYDPSTGTFLSSDPMGVSPRWPGNPFLYASGNPVLLVDPYGLFGLPSWSDVKDAAKAVGGAIVHATNDCVGDSTCSRFAAAAAVVGGFATGTPEGGLLAAGIILTANSTAECNPNRNVGACVDAAVGIASLGAVGLTQLGYQAATAAALDPLAGMLQLPFVAAVNGCLEYCPAVGDVATGVAVVSGFGLGTLVNLAGWNSLTGEKSP